jgi:hypothetical protein
MGALTRASAAQGRPGQHASRARSRTRPERLAAYRDGASRAESRARSAHRALRTTAASAFLRLRLAMSPRWPIFVPADRPELREGAGEGADAVIARISRTPSPQARRTERAQRATAWLDGGEATSPCA